VAHLLGLRYVAASVPRPMGLNLTAASQSKWLGGQSGTFIGGVEFSAAYGVAWLGMPKRLRVLHGLEELERSVMPFSEYRKLYGFLESARFALGLDGYALKGLERPFRKGQECDSGSPATPVHCDRRMAARCGPIAAAVATCPGASVLAAIVP
jgi:hypothetical protein